MKLAKVVIASALVLAACAEGLPEGKGCVLKCIQDFKISSNRSLHTETVCNVINQLFCAHYV